MFIESDQWECLSERSRQQLQRSLATMETDSRPDLKDKAQTMRRKIQALPWITCPYTHSVTLFWGLIWESQLYISVIILTAMSYTPEFTYFAIISTPALCVGHKPFSHVLCLWPNALTNVQRLHSATISHFHWPF